MRSFFAQTIMVSSKRTAIGRGGELARKRERARVGQWQPEVRRREGGRRERGFRTNHQTRDRALVEKEVLCTESVNESLG